MPLKQPFRLGIAVVLLVGALVAGLFQALLPEQARAMITGIETAIPSAVITSGLVLLLAVIAIGYLRESPADRQQPAPLVDSDSPPEEPQRPPARVGESFDTAVAEAARDVRVRQVDPIDTAPRDRLYRAAVEVLTLTESCPQSTAEEIVTEGTWTENAIAGAFLSEELEYPLGFRLFRWARPELAYERAVRRATAAVQTLASDVPGYAAPATQIGTELGLFRRLVRRITGSDEEPPEEMADQTSVALADQSPSTPSSTESPSTADHAVPEANSNE